MAESNATQVILTDDGLKIIKAQNTADNAASQASKADSAALIAQSKANAAKSAADSSYKYANSEIAVQSTATAKAQSTADNAFSKAQEVGSQASAEIVVQSNATAKAQSTADNAFSKAQAVGSQASADISRNSTATAKAQSTADNAFSQATTAIDNGKVTSQAVTNLKDGSKLTIAELENGLATKVANSEYASYQTQTASQIASKVDNGDFSTYKTQTADLIASKVANKDFSAYQATTAKEISSKVESSDFNTYKTQTADAISSKVESSNFQSLQTQVDNSMVGANLLLDSQTQTSGVHWFTTNPAWTEDWGTYLGSNIYRTSGVWDNARYRYKDLLDRGVINTTDDFTYSVYFRVVGEDPTGMSYANIDFISTAATMNGNRPAQLTSLKEGQWTRLVVTFNFVNIEYDSAHDYDYAIRVEISDSPKVAGAYYEFAAPKLEKGSVATDYSVNPEETATQSQITQLSDEIDQKVSNSEYASDKTQTASEIADRVSNSAFSTYKTQTAGLISQKVANSDFSAYQATTAKAIESKVSSSDFNTYKTQTADLIDDKVSNSAYASDKTQTASEIADRVSNSAFSTYQTQTASQIASKVDNGDFSTYKTQTADLIASKVATKDFSAYQATTAKAISSKVESKDFNTYKSQTADTIASKVNNGEFSTYKTQTAKDINLRVTKGDLIDEINLQAGNTLISSSGQLTLSGKTIYFDTKNPVIIPSANITGTLMGKELTAGTINGSTVNGSTINGTTFNAGDVINDANNTSKYYPMTITPDGSYKSTYFDSSVGLQSSVESGAIIYKHRSMIGRGQFIAYDSVINGQGLELQSGYTSTKDTTFSNPKEITGYVIVNANDGITLHGDDQQITFNGTSGDVAPKGIIITPYGNINPNGTQNIWYVGNGPTMKTASFGIDGSGANNIKFNRSLDIGNFNIGTYHTITSSDSGPIHFNRANGHSGDIYAATVHYESLAKASLLSIKRDVKKADTAYWAQLVNSIDLATYQYKTDDNTSHIRLSSIVDDVNDTKQWQLPDVFISRDEDGKLCGVDDSVLLNATLATVQEQQKEIDQLNGHNMELEARLNKLEAKLNG